MKHLILLLFILITISYRSGSKPDAPIKIRYDEEVYYHTSQVSGDFLIISLYEWTKEIPSTKTPTRMYVYSLADIYGFNVSYD